MTVLESACHEDSETHAPYMFNLISEESVKVEEHMHK